MTLYGLKMFWRLLCSKPPPEKGSVMQGELSPSLKAWIDQVDLYLRRPE